MARLVFAGSVRRRGDRDGLAVSSSMRGAVDDRGGGGGAGG